MRLHRRIAAYGLCRDNQGRVLLVRGAAGHGGAGLWFLPGGGVAHGEHPADAVRREFAEETGLSVAVHRCVDVMTEVGKHKGLQHQDRLIFDVVATGGQLHDEVAGSSDKSEWFALEVAADLPLAPFVRVSLGLAGRSALADGALGGRVLIQPRPSGPRRQRFAAYGFATDDAGRVLLTLIADGYPGAGLWHLPGGGTDFGEAADQAVLRELREETGQVGEVTGLVIVGHRHDVGAMGPERVAIDWHGVRVVYTVRVSQPSPARVIDLGGSTAAAAWYGAQECLNLPLTDLSRFAIERAGAPLEAY